MIRRFAPDARGSARRRPGGAPVGPAFAAAALLALVLPAGRAPGQEVISQQEALRLAFPEDAEVERRTAFLEEAELRRAEERAGPGVEVEQPVVTHYVATRGDSAVGVAYFDAHPVRTLQEVLMIVVDPVGRVERVEVLKFDEPREYRPPEGWLEEFRGKTLSSGSSPGDVPNITGATLTSRAVERAVRRTLALHEVIEPLKGGPGTPGPDRGDSRSGDTPGVPGAAAGAGAERPPDLPVRP